MGSNLDKSKIIYDKDRKERISSNFKIIREYLLTKEKIFS